MKKNYLLFLCLLGFLFQNCSDKGSSETTQSSSESGSAGNSEGGVATTENAGVCIWDKVVVRETPEEKGKYITTINLAEKLELLNENETDESGSKKREYTKVKLIDGKEGWVIKDFIVANAKPGVLTSDVEIYARPELMAKTNKTFKRMDVVGISECKGDWCKITGKRTGGTWIEQGWVKSNQLAYEEKDIALAIYTKQALGQQGTEKQVEELNKLLVNKDLEGSVFLADVRDKVIELTPQDVEVEDEPEPDTEIESAVEENE